MPSFLVKPRFHFSSVDVLLIVADSSAPADQKLWLHNFKHHASDAGRVFE